LNSKLMSRPRVRFGCMPTRFFCYCYSVLPLPSLDPSLWPSRSGQTTSVVIEVVVTVVRARPKPRFFVLHLRCFLPLPSCSPAMNGCRCPPFWLTFVGVTAVVAASLSPLVPWSLDLSLRWLSGSRATGSHLTGHQSPPLRVNPSSRSLPFAQSLFLPLGVGVTGLG